MLYTNNPVRNMEDHERRLEEENARREVFAYCEQCGDAIYKASSEHDGDEYIETIDGPVHVDCTRAYIRNNKKEAC